ncbi:hypothetical protein QRX50_37130 [Amycolatopsis carbonis]|uniref:Uncharacterized protein n=1 Tax=Amycolatopsis carbonis TaxID=715471 RepID=A0A9Y2ICH1_9PSEU|nr:hypothetical protein [Amycolatopsis sp. 2-15]WIX76999.1 hypothetical protein QRX50_37130 [Amycolatopsis sp. 2-15]
MSTDHSEDRPIRVILPAGLPNLTPAVARGLLAILIEVTEVPVLDGPAEEVDRDG